MKQNESAIKIGGREFLLAASIILVLMIASGVLTKVLPSGAYERIVTEDRVVMVEGSYQETAKPDYPFWRWFTAPIEVLYGEDNDIVIMLVIFLTIIGGSMAILEYAGVMQALVNTLVVRFANRKYLLIIVMITFFMCAASFIGMYEELVPLIIFIIPIAISLGWDSLTGMGMSLLPLGFGFAAAVTNPFTIGVAQKLAGLPLFSGAVFRLVFFVVIYLLVCFVVIRHAKKVEKNPQSSICYKEDEALRQRLLANKDQEGEKKQITKKQLRALIWFASWVVAGMLLVICTTTMPAISALAFPLMTILFLIGGIGAGAFAGLKFTEGGRAFGKGALGFLPGVVLVLMAYSVKHIITSGEIIDTILFHASGLISKSTPMVAAFLVYGTTLVMEFFIGSASAKAFLMMPLMTPLADLVHITRQTTVLAYNFGDGFSNLIFPTNALLLIALSFTVISYTKWLRWTWKIQVAVLVITSIFLAIAVKIGFGPF